jgi:hypothetical protein
MSGDHSRFTFDPWLDFSAVLMQQGRPIGDWDWNELTAELTRRMCADTLDTIGRAVVPRSTPNAFKIDTNAGALTIGVGRMYVDGILVENHGLPPIAWDTALVELRGTAAATYTNQPYLPDARQLPQGGPHLAYLDVWQREVTYVERPELVDVALGVDTTTRLQNVWQVKILANVGNVTCGTPDDQIPGWNDATRPSTGRLTTSTGGPADQPNPCVIPVVGNYKGLENQLYRIEIHEGGAPGQATFKWSRDNASIVARVVAIPALDRLVVDRVGRDEVLRFSDGDWIEIIDDPREFAGQSGVLVKIQVGGGVDDVTRTITLATPLPANLFPTDPQGNTAPGRHTRIRRWDQKGPIIDAAGAQLQNLDDAGNTGAITIPGGGTQVFLENGILVSFSLDAQATNGAFRRGDYWVVAARVGDASIDILNQAPPRGIHHHYARLALITLPDAETDCRVLWPPQTEHGCDCTVCVTAEDHNSGKATLQMAVDKVKSTGGTVCTGPGIYWLDEMLHLDSVRSVRLRGQGWLTLLARTRSGPVIKVENATGLTIENMAVIGSAAGGETVDMISLRSTMMCELSNLYLLGLSSEKADATAIGLSGFNLGCAIRRCVIAADNGIAGGPPQEDTRFGYPTGLEIDSNLMLVLRRGIAFPQKTIHYIGTRVFGNQIAGAFEGGIEMTGGVPPGGTVDITGNIILAAGHGLIVGTSHTRICDNEIVARDARQGSNGILLTAGLDPLGLNYCRIVGNRIMSMPGHGIAIRTRINSGMIKQNVVSETGLGGIVMVDNGAAGNLVVENNHFSNLRGAEPQEKNAIAALRFYGVRRLDLLNNIVRDYATQVASASSRAGIELFALQEARIAGNLVAGVGPIAGSAGITSGLRILPGSRQIDVVDNTIHRSEDPTTQFGAAEWRAVHMPLDVDGVPVFSPTMAFALTKRFVVSFTGTWFFASDHQNREVGIRGNVLTNDTSHSPVVEIRGRQQLSVCQFADNRCHARKSTQQAGPLVVLLAAQGVIAGSSRIQGTGSADQPALRINCALASDQKAPACTVLGNLTSAPIVVNTAVLPPDPFGKLNLIM